MISGGIFGPKLSGKTTLAIALSKQYWRTKGFRSLVLDPHLDDWGTQAWVTSNEDEFWDKVWKCRSSLIIVEEAAATIRRERELIPVFTRMRHCQHKLIVIGHSGVDLLPTMRQQLDTLYLFRQPELAAKIWADTFTEPQLLSATDLQQFEFLHCQLYKGCQRLKLRR